MTKSVTIFKQSAVICKNLLHPEETLVAVKKHYLVTVQVSTVEENVVQ